MGTCHKNLIVFEVDQSEPIASDPKFFCQGNLSDPSQTAAKRELTCSGLEVRSNKYSYALFEVLDSHWRMFWYQMPRRCGIQSERPHEVDGYHCVPKEEGSIRARSQEADLLRYGWM